MTVQLLRRMRLATAAALAVPLAAGTVTSPAAAAPSASRAYFNNPYDTEETGDPANVTRDLLIDRFTAAAPGSKVRMMTFNITDKAISDAMVQAVQNDVTVQVIMAKANCKEEAAQDFRGAAREHRPSFLKCSADSTRSPGGGIHSKYLTFSKVGSQRHLTIVGSANATVEGYADQWVDMYEYVDRKDVFKAYNMVFDVSKRLDPASQNYYSIPFNGDRARAMFYPVNDETPTSADDPVLKRINSLPSNARVQIATYAMHGKRGGWLASALIARKQDGMKIRVLTGPPTSDPLEERLRNAGIPVVHAFDPGCGSVEDDTCNYIHLKLMTAAYTVDGATQYRVWTGSDNWSDAGLHNDEVVQKIGGKAAHRQYTRFLRQIRNHYT
jgi:phosphatidylserine/phosphatidylglycerophosphate/cardiolipin synthase-like enzyme